MENEFANLDMSRYLSIDRVEELDFERSASVNEAFLKTSSDELPEPTSDDDDIAEQEVVAAADSAGLDLYKASVSIWGRQIDNVVVQVKQAFGEMASRFSGLTFELESAVRESRRSTEEACIDEQGNYSSIVDVFTTMENELNDVVRALNDAQKSKQMLVEEIKEFSRFTNELGQLADQIADNAESTTLLSLNARIEAARTGRQAEGFKVVAQEVSNHSIKSTEISDRISGLVADFNTAMTSVVDLTDRNAQQDSESVTHSKATIEKVMNRIRTVTSSLTDSSADMQRSGENIQGEISDMLVSLQFQDRVTQILEHIFEHMQTLQEKVERADSSDLDTSELLQLETWLESMESTYTTQEERSAHGSPEAETADNSSITFF